MDWVGLHSSDAYRLDVEVNDYGGSVINIGHSLDGFELNYNEKEWVQGFEGIFSFHATQEEAEDFDEVFYDIVYKQVKVKFYINSALKNVGWIKPENTTREFITPVVLYRVSFTDGLNDLSQIDYINVLNTRDTLLGIIQRAIGFLDLDDLDILIQCNLYEDILMEEGENVFKTFQVHDESFWSIEGGYRKYEDCYQVLEKVIKPFYCRLAQVDGYWQIINGQEHSSFKDIYGLDDASDISINQAHNRVIDISDVHIAGSKLEYTKIPPVRALSVIHRNKNIGSNEVDNGDFSAGTANWNNGGDSEETAGAWTSFSGSNGQLVVADNVGTGNPNEDKVFSSAPFTISDIGDGDGFFQWRFKLKLAFIQYSVGSFYADRPYLNIRLTYPDGKYIEESFVYIVEGEAYYQNAFNQKFPVNQTGDYFLSIYYKHPEHGTLDLIQLNFDDIEVTQDSTKGRVNDRSERYTSDTEGYLRLTEEIYFADGEQASYAGVLMDLDNNFSSSWTRFGFSAEGRTLMSAFAQQFLNDRRGYFDVITVSGLVDINEEINFNSILSLNSKRYRWVEYSKNYFTKQIFGTLQQVSNGQDTTSSSDLISLLEQWGLSLDTVNKGDAAAGRNVDGLMTTSPQEFSGEKTFLDILKLGINTLSGTPQKGGFEYDGSNLYFTNNTSVRKIITPTAGSYNPVPSIISNGDAAGGCSIQYTRIDTRVNFQGTINVNATAVGIVVVEIELPISSDFASINDAQGTISSVGVGTGIISPNTTNNKLTLTISTTSTGLETYKFSGSYNIIPF